MDKKVISCAFNIDTACVEIKYADGSMISIRPSVPCHHIREYRYAYGAVEPLTGDSVFLSCPIAILRV